MISSRTCVGGEFDVLVGINLLREGLDIPEVSLVAILDADKEGFLRSFRSFIQIFGPGGQKCLWPGHYVRREADRVHEKGPGRDRPEAGDPGRLTMRPTALSPAPSVKRSMPLTITMAGQGESAAEAAVNEELAAYSAEELNLDDVICDLEYKMKLAAENLEFEQAALYRDKIAELNKIRETAP